jgi:hypothetical protein
LNFKLRDSPFGGSEKYQPAYGNKLALLEHRRQAGYEPTEARPGYGTTCHIFGVGNDLIIPISIKKTIFYNMEAFLYLNKGRRTKCG